MQVLIMGSLQCYINSIRQTYFLEISVSTLAKINGNKYLIEKAVESHDKMEITKMTCCKTEVRTCFASNCLI